LKTSKNINNQRRGSGAPSLQTTFLSTPTPRYRADTPVMPLKRSKLAYTAFLYAFRVITAITLKGAEKCLYFA